MTVSRVNISVTIIRKSKRIYLSESNLLYTAAIQSKTKRISGNQLDGIAIGTGKYGLIGKPMTRMNPSIVTAYEIAHHPMRILVPEWPQHLLRTFGFTITICICKMIDIRNTEINGTILNRN